MLKLVSLPLPPSTGGNGLDEQECRCKEMVAHGKPVTYFIAACERDFLALGHIDNLLLRFGGIYMYSIFIHSKLQLCSLLRIFNVPHQERRPHATPPSLTFNATSPSLTFTQVMNLVDKAEQHGYVC